MPGIEEEEQPEPLHSAAKKFLEVVLRDVCVEGCTRHLEFQDEPDGTTTVLLIAPEQLNMPTIQLGFPAEWFPPSQEEWNESLHSEMEQFMQWMTDENRPALKSEALKEEERRKRQD